MTSTDPEIEFSCSLASPGRQAELISIYREAFDNDPVFSWLFPDDTTRKHLLDRYFTIMVDHTFAHGGSALQTEDYGAVSMFFPPHAVEQPEETKNQLLRSMRDELGSRSERVIYLLTTLDTSHPRELPPHYYGTYVAARPEHQGKGLGTRLKRSLFALADQDRAGAYAEASSKRNLALYERLGQRRLGQALTLPDGPRIFPIWRPPQATDGATR
ncbi:GNAT family N-acetyltransferase [Streptomyces sp. NPDC088116]|uniref:GNAT family N-acetyltransferase n=1 Tax=Streptomyces sp. NPDC088116 TaxID=3365825 RepID=UPI00380CBF9C